MVEAIAPTRRPGHVGVQAEALEPRTARPGIVAIRDDPGRERLGVDLPGQKAP
ncbi:MAG: hypothetical protein HY002_16160 [Candidatus Rokubacteria bacterium]|nr:hypothetical protein [Candidatus Rokubacteria bacterium]